MDTAYTIPEPADLPILNRMNQVIDYMSNAVPTGFKASGIMKRVAREMLSEMDEIPPEILEFYVKQLSTMLYWVATGAALDDMPLPENFETV